MSAAATTTGTMIAVQLAANKTRGAHTWPEGEWWAKGGRKVGERWADGGCGWCLGHLAVGTRMQFQ